MAAFNKGARIYYIRKGGFCLMVAAPTGGEGCPWGGVAVFAAFCQQAAASHPGLLSLQALRSPGRENHTRAPARPPRCRAARCGIAASRFGPRRACFSRWFRLCSHSCQQSGAAPVREGLCACNTRVHRRCDDLLKVWQCDSNIGHACLNIAQPGAASRLLPELPRGLRC